MAMRGRTRLAHVAKAVGGLDAPALEGLGLGLVTGIEGVVPRAESGTAHGRATEVSAGKDTTTGHWEMMGILLDTSVPPVSGRVPARDHRPVRGGDRARRPRERPGVGHRDRRRARRGAHGDGRPDRLHKRRLGVPGRDACRRRTARAALRVVPRSRVACSSPPHLVGRVIARPFDGGSRVRSCGVRSGATTQRRSAGPHRARHARRCAGVRSVRRRQDPGHLRPSRAHRRRVLRRTKRRRSDRRGVCATHGPTSCSPNLVDFDSKYGHRNDPAGYAARDRGARPPFTGAT